MTDTSRVRTAEIVTGAIHAFVLTGVLKVLLFAYSQVQQLPTAATRSGGVEMSGFGANPYYSFVLTLVVAMLTFGGGPFALVVLGRNFAGTRDRLIEIGLAAAFLSVGLFSLFAPFPLPFHLRVAGAGLLCVLAIALPVAVAYRYYAAT